MTLARVMEIQFEALGKTMPADELESWRMMFTLGMDAALMVAENETQAGLKKLKDESVEMVRAEIWKEK